MTDNASLGSPKGRILLDTSSITQAKAIVVAAAQNIKTALGSITPDAKQVADKFRDAEKAAQAFAKTDLGVVRQGLQNAAQQFAAVSAAAAAMTAGGIAAAQSMRQLNSTYAALLGSGERAQAVLQEIRDLADEYKLPFTEAANGAKGFLAVINSSDLSMRELVLTSQRLRLLNQAEGAEGAAFALKELLANDVTSIVERFNISRTAVNAIKAEANGDQEKILRGLNEYLDSIGVTEAALLEMGQSGANAFARLRSSITEAASTAFTPFLESVVLPAVEGFASFLDSLRQTNPALLQLGSIFTVVTAGIAPMLFLLSQTITAFETLRRVGPSALDAIRRVGGIQVAGTTLGRVAATAAVTYGALEVGNRAGLGLSRFLADQGVGDQRLRSDSGEEAGDVINERIRQVFVIFLSALTDLAVGIQSGRFVIENAINLVASAIRLLGLRVADGGLQFVGAIAQVISQLGENLGLADVKAFGDELQATITRLREGDSAIRTATGEGSPTPYIGADGQMHLTGTAPVIQGEYQGGTLGQIKAAEDILANGVAFTEDQLAALGVTRESLNRELQAFIQSFMTATPEVEEAASDGADDIRTGGQTLAERLLELAKSKEWQDILKAIDENARKIKEANDERLIGVGREAEDFARGRMRALADEQKQNDRLQRQQFDRERQQIAAIAQLQTEASKEEAQLLTKDLQEREREFEEHNRRLLDIQRQGHFAIVDAIADGDGVAAVRAVRNAQEQTRKENEDYALRQKQRNEDLQEQRKSLTDQRDERLRDAVQQLNDMRVQFAEQRAEREADFWERLGREDEDRSIRLQREQEDFDRRRALELADNQRRLVEMQSQFFVEAGLFQSFQSTVSTVFQRIRDDGVRYFGDLYRSIMGLGAYGAPNTPLNGIGMIGGGASVRAIPQAASGAMLLSDGLVYAHNREIILNESQQRSYLGGGSYQVQVSAPITVIANEPFDYESMVEDVSDRVTMQVAETIRRVRDAQ